MAKNKGDTSVLEFLFVGPLFSINKLLKQIRRDISTMATQADIDALAGKVTAAAEQQTKALGEIQTQVQALKDQIANLPEPQPALDLSALDSAVNQAVAGAQALDDLNPDESSPEPVEPEEDSTEDV